MIIRPLFDKYQKYLLQFANTDYGKAFICDNWGGKIEKKDVVTKITPDGFHLLKDFINDKPIIQATFFPRSPYISKFRETLTYLSILEENKRMDLVKDISKLGRYIYLAETTFNPDADPESTSVDGRAGRTGVNETFGTIRAGAGNDSSDTLGAIQLLLRHEALNISDRYQSLYRLITLFDTSSLTSNATISAATYSLYVTSVVDTLDAESVRLVTSTPASNTAIVNGDYANLGTTAQTDSDLALGSMTISAYNDWTMNSTGIGNISLTSISKFGGRTTHDATGTSPTWADGAASSLYGNFADAGSNKPKLVVTYTLPSGAFLPLL